MMFALRVVTVHPIFTQRYSRKQCFIGPAGCRRGIIFFGVLICQWMTHRNPLFLGGSANSRRRKVVYPDLARCSVATASSLTPEINPTYNLESEELLHKCDRATNTNESVIKGAIWYVDVLAL
jgi:hypothetical protein